MGTIGTAPIHPAIVSGMERPLFTMPNSNMTRAHVAAKSACQRQLPVNIPRRLRALARGPAKVGAEPPFAGIYK